MKISGHRTATSQAVFQSHILHIIHITVIVSLQYVTVKVMQFVFFLYCQIQKTNCHGTTVHNSNHQGSRQVVLQQKRGGKKGRQNKRKWNIKNKGNSIIKGWLQVLCRVNIFKTTWKSIIALFFSKYFWTEKKTTPKKTTKD